MLAVMEIMGQKIWTKLAILAALTMISYTKATPNIVMSPLTESSYQDNSVCIRYLNSTLAEFMLKLNRPVNASSGMLHVGKDVEEIINKKMTDLMLGCRGNSTGPPPTVASQMNQDGKNFYVDQLAIQKIDFKPRLKSEVEDIIKVDTLKVTLNAVIEEKRKQQALNKEQAQLLRNYHEEIEELKRYIVMMKQSQIHEISSGIEHQVKLKEIQVQLADAPKRYNSLKAQIDEIMKKFCNCQKCTANQKPSLAHYSGRSSSVDEAFTTED